MTKNERETFLADVHVGIISIARPGRGPLSVPIWYAYEPGGELWVITGRDSLKGRLLRDAGRFSLCAQTESPPYRYVSVEGQCSIRESDKASLEQMAVRYLGDVQGAAYAAAANDDGSSIIVSMKPDAWLTVDYSKR